MKTIKIIDLLNKIANGEDVPKNIKYEDYNWFWCEACHIYETTLYNEKGNKTINLYTWFSDEGNLNDEVEILEEEKKLPEKLDYLGLKIREGNLSKQDVIMLCDYIDYQTQNINQLIDYLESKEKGGIVC